jgi:hypothetical protein
MQPHIVRANNYRVVQKAPGGLPPLMQLQMLRDIGPQAIEEELSRRRVIADWSREKVQAERVAAIARGVHVVLEDSRPDFYTIVELPDEGPRAGT